MKICQNMPQCVPNFVSYTSLCRHEAQICYHNHCTMVQHVFPRANQSNSSYGVSSYRQHRLCKHWVECPCFIFSTKQCWTRTTERIKRPQITPLGILRLSHIGGFNLLTVGSHLSYTRDFLQLSHAAKIANDQPMGVATDR